MVHTCRDSLSVACSVLLVRACKYHDKIRCDADIGNHSNPGEIRCHRAWFSDAGDDNGGGHDADDRCADADDLAAAPPVVAFVPLFLMLVPASMVFRPFREVHMRAGAARPLSAHVVESLSPRPFPVCREPPRYVVTKSITVRT